LDGFTELKDLSIDRFISLFILCSIYTVKLLSPVESDLADLFDYLDPFGELNLIPITKDLIEEYKLISLKKSEIVQKNFLTKKPIIPNDIMSSNYISFFHYGSEFVALAKSFFNTLEARMKSFPKRGHRTNFSTLTEA
jgi:hypothetical protein